VLRKIFDYTPEAMKTGSMWWWLLPFAPGAPERLIVGNERAFLTWFYGFASADPNSIEPAAIDEYLRTFSGTEGVLGALGVYRAAFTTIDQTEPLTRNKVRVPVIALGGEKAQGGQDRRNGRTGGRNRGGRLEFPIAAISFRKNGPMKSFGASG
jgi:hypothetical protein